MATVTVKLDDSQLDASLVAIDDKKMSFSSGTATRNAASGDHALTWFVRGAPGSKYKISITTPSEAVFAHSGTIDSSNTDAGVQWFRVN